MLLAKAVAKVVDEMFILIKSFVYNIFTFAFQVLFIGLFFAITMFLFVPKLTLHTYYGCLSDIDQCDGEYDFETNTEYYMYLFNNIWNMLCDVFEPAVDFVFQKYVDFRLRVQFSDFLGEAATAFVKLGFRTLSVAEEIPQFTLSGIKQAVRIIFDSGASTNLVFYPLPNDLIVGPRKLNLAAGMTSEGNLTRSGEVTLPSELVDSGKVKEELISMGRFALRGGKIVWEGPNCDLYLRNQYTGALDFLFRLQIENSCPMMTQEQAQTIRELQRAEITGLPHYSVSQVEETDEFSPSLVYLHQTDSAFDEFYKMGRFQGNEHLLGQASPTFTQAAWKAAKSAPVSFFLQQLRVHCAEQDAWQQSILDMAASLDGSRASASTPTTRQRSSAGESASSANAVEHGHSSSAQDNEISYLSQQLSDSLDPTELSFRPVFPRHAKASAMANDDFGHGPQFAQSRRQPKSGPNPNAQKAPQGKTTAEEKLKFYRSTKGAWVIWADVHYCTHEGFDNSIAIWVYHCSRLKPKNPAKPKIEEIETVELCYPIREKSDGPTACSGLRYVLESLGIWTDLAETKNNFFFESEVENVLESKIFKDYLLACHDSHHESVPYRHPAKEYVIRNLLLKIRSHLQKSSLPLSAWPAIARGFSEEACKDIANKPYPNRTFSLGYKVEDLGKLVYAHVPGLKHKSIDNKQVPAVLLNSSARNRVYIIHAIDETIGFRYTSVEWTQISFPVVPQWAFETKTENLRLQRFMKAPFKSKLVAKKDRPRRLGCSRCVRLNNRGDRAGAEHDQDVKGHTGDRGCNYQIVDCFSDLIFEPGVNYFSDCPMAEIITKMHERFDKDLPVETHSNGLLVKDGIQQVPFSGIVGEPDPEPPTVRECFQRPLDTERNDNLNFQDLKLLFHNNNDLQDQVFNNPDMSAEECATLLFLARTEIQLAMFKEWEIEKEKYTRAPLKPGETPEQFYGMVIMKNKDVLKNAAAIPKEFEEWLAANNKELDNLIQRGVLKLVLMSDLKNLDPSTYELIPSLVVYSQKDTGRKKSRLVACGNYQLTADKDVEGIQSGVYAGTTSTIVWRSLINIFCQSRASVACMDVSEAFTQTDQESQSVGGERARKTFLRLPSQWKSILLPTYLKNAGCNTQNYGTFLLEILKSIYGETFAPKRWQETLERVLISFGFKKCQLEESLFFMIKNNKITIISTYVDDIWVFSQDASFMVTLMFQISTKLRCTPGEILCGAPDFMWKYAAEKSSAPTSTNAGRTYEEPTLANPTTRQSSISDTASGSEAQEAKAATRQPSILDMASSPLTKHQREVCEFFKPLTGEKRYGVATKESPVSYVSIDLYFQNNTLVLDQSSYVEKSYKKMMDKKVFSESEVFHMNSLRQEDFHHLHMFEPCEKNPLLTKEQLSFLRIGVNTLSFYALSVGIGIQSALGQVARGQSAGRLRHLESLKKLIFYTFQHRHCVLEVECPSYMETDDITVDMLRIFTTATVDASLGMSNALGCDAFARQGCIVNVGVIENKEAPVQGKSSLQSTVSLSTCEAELTAASWAAKIIIGLVNLFHEVFRGAHIETPSLYGDNRAANLLASNQASMRNHRHLALPQIWIRQQTKIGRLKIFNIKGLINPADLLTKVLPHEKLIGLLQRTGYRHPRESIKLAISDLHSWVDSFVYRVI